MVNLSVLKHCKVSKYYNEDLRSETFPVSTRSKTFLTRKTAMGIQQMSKIPSRLVVKPKFIQSL